MWEDFGFADRIGLLAILAISVNKRCRAAIWVLFQGTNIDFLTAYFR